MLVVVEYLSYLHSVYDSYKQVYGCCDPYTASVYLRTGVISNPFHIFNVVQYVYLMFQILLLSEF